MFFIVKYAMSGESLMLSSHGSRFNSSLEPTMAPELQGEENKSYPVVRRASHGDGRSTCHSWGTCADKTTDFTDPRNCPGKVHSLALCDLCHSLFADFGQERRACFCNSYEISPEEVLR